MAFFTFHQNNSGGSFDHDEDAGIGYKVAIEAPDAATATERAQVIGIYFNGCDAGLDCNCCGDRWSDYLTDDDGTDEPTCFGDGDPLRGGWGIPSYIHYADGRIEAVPEPTEAA